MQAKIESVARLLNQDLRTVHWSGMRFEHVSAIRARLQESGLAPATINATLCALRGVAAAAWHLGQMSGEDYQRIKSVKSVRGSRLPAGRALHRGEVAALLDACALDETPAGARDAALLALLVGAGLRRSECAGLDLSDYDAATGALRVRGKGDKERITYLTGGAAQALADWLVARGSGAGALICPVRKSGTVMVQSLTPQSVYNALIKRASAARVRRFSPHDLRRTFVSDLLDAGADISAVQQLVGPANIQTTARYDRRAEASKGRTARLVHLPDRGREPRLPPTLV